MDITPKTKLSPTDGSSLYYSLLQVDPEARVRVCQTLNLIKVISTTLFEVTDPSVAEKKIHWWHEELARLAKRTARHPACVEVQAYLYRADAVQACLSILSTAANERYSPLNNVEELHEMIVVDYSARLTLVERALSEQSKPYKLNTIALGLGHAHRLGTLAERLQHGYAVFSDEQYTQFELTPAQLLDEPTNNNKLLTTIVNETSATLAQAQEELSDNLAAVAVSLPVRTMLKLRTSQVNLWKKTKPDLTREYITVTPLRKFFLSYSCKRQFAKIQRNG